MLKHTRFPALLRRLSSALLHPASIRRLAIYRCRRNGSIWNVLPRCADHHTLHQALLKIPPPHDLDWLYACIPIHMLCSKPLILHRRASMPFRPHSRLLRPLSRHPGLHARRHVRHGVHPLLLPHPQHGQRVLDRTTRFRLRPSLQRFRRLRRSNAFRRREIVAGIRLPDDAPRCGDWIVRHYWAVDTAFETAIARDGSECAGKDGLEFSEIIAVLDLLALEFRYGHGLLLPLAVHALLRSREWDDFDAGSAVACAYGCVAGRRADEFRVPVGSESVH